MYCSHFGLHRPPFNNTPDPSFYYSTPDHEEAIATLQYATCHRKGFVLVTGEIGAGKTLVGRMFIRQLDRAASTAVITHTHLNARQFLASICAEFELPVPADATNLQLADTLQEFLLEQFARDRFVVVLIDEGQNLPDESFEALRMLGNLEADDAKLLQVCILGQPELRERFRRSSMKQLHQRLFRRFHLPALNEQQSAEYIRRRLSVAGASRDDIFTDEAIQRVFVASQGIPRVINQICDNAMLAAYGQGATTVDASIVVEVLDHDHPAECDRKDCAVRGPAAGPLAVAGASVSWTEAAPAGVAVAKPSTRLVPNSDTDILPSAPTPEETQVRIERIYGSRPIFTSTVADEGIRQIRESQKNDTDRLLGEIARIRTEFQHLLEQGEQRWAQTRERLNTLAAEAVNEAALADLQAKHKQRIEETLEDLEALTDELNAVRDSHRMAMVDLALEADATRREHATVVGDLNSRVDAVQEEQRAAVGALNRRVNAVQDEHRIAVGDLNSRVDAVLEEQRNAVADLEAVRNDHQLAIAGILARLDEKSRELGAFKSSLAEREVEIAEEQRTAVTELADRIEDQSEEVRGLRQRFLEQHDSIREQITALREESVTRVELDRLREAQAAQAAGIVSQIEQDRESVQELIDAVAHRCQITQERLTTLAAAATENQQQLAELRQAQAEDVASLLRQLEEQRLQMSRQFEDGLARIDDQSDEYQQAVHELHRRWERLCDQVNELATTTVTADRFTAAEESINRDLASLKAEVGTVQSQRQEDVRHWVEVVQRLTERVKQLEELDRPQPIRLEMQPAAARTLAEMTAAADERTAALRELLGNSGAVSDRLVETSAQVEGVMQHWLAHADEVREQSDQLRTSAKTAANILRAMRKCQDAINDKLRSERWQTELGRAETLTARLETATRETQTLYQQLRALLADCRDESETWAARREEAGRLTSDLSQLIGESKAARGRFVQLMSAIAANTSGIAKAIDSARQFDEAVRPTSPPTRGNSNRTDPPAVSRIAWAGCVKPGT